MAEDPVLGLGYRGEDAALSRLSRLAGSMWTREGSKKAESVMPDYELGVHPRPTGYEDSRYGGQPTQDLLREAMKRSLLQRI